MDQNAYMQRRENEKALAIAEIANVLDGIAREGRTPDAWERVYLVYALNAVFSGGYGLARTDARLAQTPVDERGANPHLPDDPLFDKCDLPLLQRALRAVKAEPVRQFPSLGPIVLE